MQPVLEDGQYIYAVVDDPPSGLSPFATVREDEGTTVVVRREEADRHGLTSSFVCRRITLRVHSSLEAVGLTAAVSTALARLDISCNGIAGSLHDHLFVPDDRAEDARDALLELSRRAGRQVLEGAAAAGPAVFGELGEPDASVSDPHQLLSDYLDWYRDRLIGKLDGLSDTQLRASVIPLGWSPLGMVKHLSWVERRWMRWGFAAEDIVAYPTGGDEVEWGVAEEATEAVIAGYLEEVQRSRALAAAAGLDDRAQVGSRFKTLADAPTLGRILFHLLQEYARHVGQLDVARELIDGETGE